MKKSVKQMIIPSVACLVMSNSWHFAYADKADTVLDKVVVQSTSLPDYQVTTEVITADKIKEMGATNLAEAIGKVPGLYVAYGGKGSYMVRIRGAATDQTKIYMDGMPVFPMSGIASNSMSNLSTIPIENIEKIEIIKGPGPVQYGTDYKGGVILITTKTGKGPGHGNLQLAAGSHASYDNSFSFSGSKDKFSYYIAAGRQQSDGYLRNSDFTKDYFDGKLKWGVSKDAALTLSGYYMDTDRKIPNGIDQATGAEMTTPIPWSGDKSVNGMWNTKDWKHTGLKQTNAALQFEQRVSNTFKYNVKIYHVRDDDHLWVYNGNNASSGTNTYANPIWYLSNWYSGGNGFEFTGDLLTARSNTVTFGMKYTNVDWNCTENDSSSDEHGTDKRYGYYLQDAISLSAATKLTLGVRKDRADQAYHYSKTGKPTYDNSSSVDTSDPVLNLTHHIDDKNELRFSAGKTHVFVTAKQASANLVAGLALPDAEKAQNYEVGWAHNFDHKSSLDVAVFKNNINGRITQNSDKTSPLYTTYYNVGETNINGVEIAYNKKISERLKGFVNYTYQHAKDTSASGVETNSYNLPKNMTNYGITYTVDKFQTSLYGHILSKVPTDSKTYPWLASYNTVDLDFRYSRNKDTEYFLRVNNLLNTNYWETAAYPAEGINFMLGINYKI